MSGEFTAALRKAIADGRICASCGRLALFIAQAQNDSPQEVAAVVALWNRDSRPPVMRCAKARSRQRDAKISARAKEWPDIQQWELLIDWLWLQPWYRGGNPTGWVADLRWVVDREENFDRLMSKALTAQKLCQPTRRAAPSAARTDNTDASPDAGMAQSVLDELRRGRK